MTQRPHAARRLSAIALAASFALAAGCNHLGSSRIETVERPDSVTDFKILYSQNCSGCHGANGQNGASIDLANPAYQAWVSDSTLQRIIAMGEPPTQMPAFAISAGGTLTDAQVDALVKGMRTAWPADPSLQSQMPPAQPANHGDAEQGQKTYETACLRCHSDAKNKVTEPTYLALINNRTLRAIIIAGRPDLGHPDWRGDIPGRALTGQEIEDIVAYLNSLRSDTPGQPYTPQP
jgi:cytochrome c oxidase cbb3-type subunit III